MSKNTGTLVGAPVKKNDSEDVYAAFETNDGKGTPKIFPTLLELHGVALAERDWGMLGVVYNDGANTGIYFLKRGHVDSDLSNNNNWKNLFDEIAAVAPNDNKEYVLKFINGTKSLEALVNANGLSQTEKDKLQAGTVGNWSNENIYIGGPIDSLPGQEFPGQDLTIALTDIDASYFIYKTYDGVTWYRWPRKRYSV